MSERISYCEDYMSAEDRFRERQYIQQAQAESERNPWLNNTSWVAELYPEYAELGEEIRYAFVLGRRRGFLDMVELGRIGRGVKIVQNKRAAERQRRIAEAEERRQNELFNALYDHVYDIRWNNNK